MTDEIPDAATHPGQAQARGQALSTRAMLDDLRRLVDLDAPTGDVRALTDSAQLVADLLEHRLGGAVRLIESPAGPHLLWSGGGTPTVLILGHHDTVFPIGTAARRPFTIDARRARGPGVFDMLGGLVQAIHGVASLPDRTGVQILVTADEESGSHASRALIEHTASECAAVLVVEGAAAGGGVKIGRKGCGTFVVTVIGRAAHSGLDPEGGINALIEAAYQVLDIAALSRPELGTTVTPTVASAGTFDNVIPDRAIIAVDVRVASIEEQERVELALSDLRPHLPGATVHPDGAVTRPPMPAAASTTLFDIARRLRPGIEGRVVGGGSDGNFTAALGISTLDGLGAVGGGAHTDEEYVEVDAMADRAQLMAELVCAARDQEKATKTFRSPA